MPAYDVARVVELDIQGMTCASCVRRVERKLGFIDGVHATVNLPLETARVLTPAGVDDQQLLDGRADDRLDALIDMLAGGVVAAAESAFDALEFVLGLGESAFAGGSDLAALLA